MQARPPGAPPVKVMLEKVQHDMTALLRENELLKQKLLQRESDLLEMQKQNTLTTNVQAQISSPTKAIQLHGALPRPPNILTSSLQSYPSTATSTIMLPNKLDGSNALWRVPFNGKNMAEKRILSIAVEKSDNALMMQPIKFIDLKAETIQSTADASHAMYMKLPISLCWYPPGSDLKGEEMAEVMRELILSQGTHIILGHTTKAFQKLLKSGGPLPRPELCFSVVTATRTLDLAAETRQDAEEWIQALQVVLSLVPQNHVVRSPSNHGSPSSFYAARSLVPTSPSAGAHLHPRNSYAAPLHTKPVLSISSTLAPHRSVPPSPTSQAFGSRPLPWQQRLYAAAQTGDVELLEDIVRGGAFVDAELDSGTRETALMMAARLGHINIMRLCLQYGAKNDPHPDYGMTALHAAVVGNQYDAAAVLLQTAAKSKADTIICNLSNSVGHTPLHVAITKGDVTMIEMLIAHGADLHRTDVNGSTCLHLAAEGGHSEALALMLIDFDGDLLMEMYNHAGYTPLHVSILAGHMACVRVLLESAADPFAGTLDGKSPLDLCILRGSSAMGVLLVEYQARPDPTVKREDSKYESTLAQMADLRTQPSPILEFIAEDETWGVYVSEDGYEYYSNSKGESQWDDPRDFLPCDVKDEQDKPSFAHYKSSSIDEAVESDLDVVDPCPSGTATSMTTKRSMWTQNISVEQEDEEEIPDQTSSETMSYPTNASGGSEKPVDPARIMQIWGKFFENVSERRVAQESPENRLAAFIVDNPYLEKYVNMKHAHSMPVRHIRRMMILAGIDGKKIERLVSLLGRDDKIPVEYN